MIRVIFALVTSSNKNMVQFQFFHKNDQLVCYCSNQNCIFCIAPKLNILYFSHCLHRRKSRQALCNRRRPIRKIYMYLNKIMIPGSKIFRIVYSYCLEMVVKFLVKNQVVGYFASQNLYISIELTVLLLFSQVIQLCLNTSDQIRSLNFPISFV